MTNEQLAVAIKDGGADDLIPVLWERTKRFIFRECNRMYNRQPEAFAAHGLTIDDFTQEAYTAFLSAIRSYTPDNGFSFLAYLHYPLLKMRNRLLRLDGHAADTLAHVVSLDMPISADDGEIGTLIDLIDSDEQSPEIITDQQSLCDIVNAAVDRLSDNERTVIQSYFYDEEPLSYTAKRLNISRQRAAQLKDAALNRLRNDPDIMQLHKAIDT